jgi:hypothetical protein
VPPTVLGRVGGDDLVRRAEVDDAEAARLGQEAVAREDGRHAWNLLDLIHLRERQDRRRLAVRRPDLDARPVELDAAV